jgi:type II secretory pathway predicted ATPase ExeA
MTEDLKRIARRRIRARLGLAIHGAVVLLGQSGLRQRMEADELRKLESR